MDEIRPNTPRRPVLPRMLMSWGEDIFTDCHQTGCPSPSTRDGCKTSTLRKPRLLFRFYFLHRRWSFAYSWTTPCPDRPSSCGQGPQVSYGLSTAVAAVRLGSPDDILAPLSWTFGAWSLPFQGIQADGCGVGGSTERDTRARKCGLGGGFIDGLLESLFNSFMRLGKRKRGTIGTHGMVQKDVSVSISSL